MKAGRRWWVWAALLGLIVLLPVLAVWYLAWRGEQEWEATRRELVGRGERLTVAELVPGPVADERNFFGGSMWKEVVVKGTGVWKWGYEHYEPMVAEKDQQLGILTRPTPRLELEELKKRWPRFSNIEREVGFPATRISLLKGINYKAIKDETLRTDCADFTLAALKPAEPLLDEIAELLKRPEARFPVEYEKGYSAVLAHLPKFMEVATAFRLRAKAERQTGRNAEAARDGLVLLGLSHTLRDDPFDVGFSYRLQIFRMAINLIAEGQQAHVWTDEELKAFEKSLREESFLPGLLRSFRWERARYNGAVEQSLQGSDMGMVDVWQRVDSNGLSVGSWIEGTVRSMPSGIYVGLFSRYDQATENRLVQGALDALEARGGRGVNTDPAFELPVSFESGIYAASHPISKYAMYELRRVFGAVFAQDQAVQARLAIGLERYYLAHKEYPETLEELVPTYLEELPVEVLTGKAMHYKRTEPGAFLLWADGWDGKDDGGRAAEWRNLEVNDWVWGKP